MAHIAIGIIQDEHGALAAMLQSIGMMIDRGPGNEAERFFDTLRAMLFYIDEFPEKLHHPKESEILFPLVARLAPEVQATLDRLEKDHVRGEENVRELQHLLLAWELLGESRRSAFEVASKGYIGFYLEHMRLEESIILPAAKRVLNDAHWKEVDTAFASNCDPLTGKYARDPVYDRLFTKIVTNAPSPIGVGTDA